MLDKVVDFGKKYGAHIACFAAGAAVGYWAGSPSSSETQALVSRYEEEDKKKKAKKKDKKDKKKAKKFMEKIGEKSA